MLEQAGAFGPLPGFVVVADEHPEAPLGELGAVTPQLIPGQGRVLGGAALALIDAHRREFMAMDLGAPGGDDTEMFIHGSAAVAATQTALAFTKHLSGTLGLSVRREPEEAGHGAPRFTLLATSVGEDGQASVEVLVPVAPWHHVQDGIERFVRATLTPREYR
jgi:hypothetical protein